MVALFFVIAFILVPVLELWLILQVGSLIGAPATIALLLLDSLLGAWLVRSQGSAVWQRFRGALDSGRIPAAEAVDGFLVVLGGTLLLVPGFISDICGLLCILPPTRKLLRVRLIRSISRRTRVNFTARPGRDETRVRDFAHSDQPRRPTSSTRGEREPDFDFETHQLRE